MLRASVRWACVIFIASTLLWRSVVRCFLRRVCAAIVCVCIVCVHAYFACFVSTFVHDMFAWQGCIHLSVFGHMCGRGGCVELTTALVRKARVKAVVCCMRACACVRWHKCVEVQRVVNKLELVGIPSYPKILFKLNLLFSSNGVLSVGIAMCIAKVSPSHIHLVF